jgi:23S rRNA pseudouridine2605 synthase
MEKSGFHFATAGEKERIAKRMARSGLCSRREAEAIILAGRVSVNGTVLDSPAFTVGPMDRVLVDGKRLGGSEPTRLWRYYKPRGLIVSNQDEKGRQTIYDALPENLPRLVSVGRLDMDSEGLLLLTNDGALARHLELPQTGWLRKYRVRVHGRIDETKLEALQDGIEIDGFRYDSLLARLDSQMNSNAWLTISIREGKNREIRKVMEHMGWPVSRLIRLSYGPFMLGKLEAGAIAEVPTASLMDQLGLGRPIQKKRTPRLRLAKSQTGAAGETGIRKAGQKKAGKKTGKNATHHRRKPPRHKT